MSTETKDAWSANLYNKNAHFVYSDQYTTPVLSLLDAKDGERILDIGCGSGEITLKLEKIVGEQGLVVGTDFSEDMINKCHTNGLKNAFVADAQALTFPPEWKKQAGSFDAVFTNAALHWCKRDPSGVIKSAKAALKKDGSGRFVGEFGGHLNVVGLRSCLRHVGRAKGLDAEKVDPWFFPSVEEYRNLLESEGFKVAHIELVPRPTPLPGHVVDWMRTFVRTSWLEGLSDSEAEAIIQEVGEMYAVDGKDRYGNWSIMYVRLRFVAVLPA